MFLPGAPLAATLTAQADVATAVREADVVVSAGPSHAVREVMTRAGTHLGRGALVVSVSKGLEPERLGTLSCVLGEVLPQGTPVAVLSGPSFAQEVYMHQPTAVVAGAPGPPRGPRRRQGLLPAPLPGGPAAGRDRGGARVG